MYGYINAYIYINIREIPAFGGISLALRGGGALGVPVRAPESPIWGTAAFGGGERNKKKKQNLGHHGRPGRGVSLAYAAFGGDKKNVKNLGRHERPIFGAPGAPRSGRQLTPPSAAIEKMVLKT